MHIYNIAIYKRYVLVSGAGERSKNRQEHMRNLRDCMTYNQCETSGRRQQQRQRIQTGSTETKHGLIVFSMTTHNI